MRIFKSWITKERERSWIKKDHEKNWGSTGGEEKEGEKKRRKGRMEERGKKPIFCEMTGKKERNEEDKRAKVKVDGK